MRRRVFLVTESDEYLIGTVIDILNSNCGNHIGSVIMDIVDEMIFGDHFYIIDTEQKITIQIR